MSFTFGFLLFRHVFSGDNRANKLEKWKRNVRRLKHVGAVGFVSIIYDIFSYKYLDTFDIMEDNPFNIPFLNKRISFAVGFRWLLLLSWGSFLRQRLQILYFVFILMTNSSSWSLWQKYCRQIIPKTRGLKTLSFFGHTKCKRKTSFMNVKNTIRFDSFHPRTASSFKSHEKSFNFNYIWTFLRAKTMKWNRR